MSKNILVVFEKQEFDYELAGQVDYKLNVYDLDMLNEMSVLKFEDDNFIKEKQKEINEKIEMVDDGWSFVDMEEYFLNDRISEAKGIDKGYSIEFSTGVLNKVIARNIFDFKKRENYSANQIFYNELLEEYFDKEDLEKANITSKFIFKSVVKLDIEGEVIEFNSNN